MPILESLDAAATIMGGSPGAMQLGSLQTIDRLGPSASNPVLLALPLQLMPFLKSVTSGEKTRSFQGASITFSAGAIIASDRMEANGKSPSCRNSLLAVFGEGDLFDEFHHENEIVAVLLLSCQGVGCH